MIRKRSASLFYNSLKKVSTPATKTVIDSNLSSNTFVSFFNSNKVRDLSNLSLQFTYSSKMFSLKTQHNLLNKPAPSIKLKNQDDEWVELKSFIGNGKPSVIFFYPKDETYGCTKEVCGFRDSYSVFSDAGATVVGISSDSVDKHKKFSESQKLQFPLLSDPDGEARKLYEAKILGLLPGRVTFLIDKDGNVHDVFNSMMDFDGHVKKSVEFVKSNSSSQ